MIARISLSGAFASLASRVSGVLAAFVRVAFEEVCAMLSSERHPAKRRAVIKPAAIDLCPGFISFSVGAVTDLRRLY